MLEHKKYPGQQTRCQDHRKSSSFQKRIESMRETQELVKREENEQALSCLCPLRALSIYEGAEFNFHTRDIFGLLKLLISYCTKMFNTIAAFLGSLLNIKYCTCFLLFFEKSLLIWAFLFLMKLDRLVPQQCFIEAKRQRVLFVQK